jgi:hypothetical protein
MKPRMAFDVECVRKHLLEKGFVFTVRGFDEADGEIEAYYHCPEWKKGKGCKRWEITCRCCKGDGIRILEPCYRGQIVEIKNQSELYPYALLSGFDKPFSDRIGWGTALMQAKDEWWAVIEKMCGDKPKFLYLVVKI